MVWYPIDLCYRTGITRTFSHMTTTTNFINISLKASH